MRLRDESEKQIHASSPGTLEHLLARLIQVELLGHAADRAGMARTLAEAIAAHGDINWLALAARSVTPENLFTLDAIPSLALHQN
jgi:hypothetical protein